MPTGPRLLLDNVCYHITSRGNQKQKVFIEDEDFKYYLAKLRKYKHKYGFLLYADCLMPNHPHLLGEIKNPKDLSHFMHDLTRSYTSYFNDKYKKVGHLWQGRFQSRIVTKDDYLIDCINYIELNPVRAGLVKSPMDWPYSSYRERVLGVNKEYAILDDLVI
ncbi:MAG: transposase [Candidatus Omnitrophica bacterium]|nr:transposase [Candidatus Omnitrophota bacterium]